MGFFSSRYTKEGPGVRKDEPKKKGLARFWEVISRDYSNIFKVNLLFLLCCIPALAAVLFGYLFRQYLGMVLIAAVVYFLGCMLMGMGMTAMHGCLVKIVRDEPFYMWHEFKRYWKANWKQSIYAGLVFGIAGVLIAFSTWFYLFKQNSMRVFFLAFEILCLFTLVTCWLLTTLQMLFLDLKLMPMIKNSLLLMCGFLKRTLPGGALMILLFGVILMYTPLPFLPLPFLIGLPAITALVGDLWMWPVMEEVFHITEQQAAKKQAEENDAQ